ncbi:molybdenum cofactor guanylyltransferase [Myxococcaceae bacterium]|jgi:molybdopterin-guanine dinucleotide biosynthesis protein A|nr:molybdenum cofactor guanylyltransferase [Myxococcaceae bacterium]
MNPASERSRTGVSGAVLLGGASRRMGRDKASLPIGGVAGAERIARVLARLCDEVLLVGGTPPPGAQGRVVADPEGPRCALRGLVAALDAAAGSRVLVVATDLPLVSRGLLEALLAAEPADAVVPKPGLAQPLCAVYRRASVLPIARARLAAGNLALRSLLDALEVRSVEGAALAALDPEGRALSNLNTPEDHARAEAWLAARREGRRESGSEG